MAGGALIAEETLALSEVQEVSDANDERAESPPGKGKSKKIRFTLQGSKLIVASSKFATGKSHLPPAKTVGSKKLLPGNSVMI